MYLKMFSLFQWFQIFFQVGTLLLQHQKIFAWNDITRYGFSHHVSELERRRMLLLVISIYEYFYPILRRYLDQISVDERNSEKLKWCLLWWWRKNWFSSSLLCMVYWLLCVCYDSIGLFTNLSWLKYGSPLCEWNQMIKDNFATFFF